MFSSHKIIKVNWTMPPAWERNSTILMKGGIGTWKSVYLTGIYHRLVVIYHLPIHILLHLYA